MASFLFPSDFFILYLLWREDDGGGGKIGTWGPS
jgi:hypothetical protein